MDIFSNLQVMGECLLDQKRTTAFNNAIFEVVKKGDVVIDAGTGSGIMALFSAKAGAKKVYGIEIAKDVARIAKHNVESNNFNNIEIINDDVTKIILKNRADVVIMEMLDTGLIAEQQTQAVNNLIDQDIINQNTSVIPYKINTYIELIDYDFGFYGFQMPFILQARNYGANKHVVKVLSERTLYDSVVFNKKINNTCNKKIRIKANDNGVINAVRIRNRIFLSPRIKIWGTSDLCMPVILPIEKFEVKKGEMVNLQVRYHRSSGFDKVQIKPSVKI